MSTPETAAETLAKFDRTWAEVEALVMGLDERALTEVRDPAGWSAKDHLMHVARWEQALLAKVDGRPRHEALGIDAVTDRTGDDDTINAAIFAATRDRSLKDVLHALRETHAATRARLAAAVTLLGEVPGYADHYDQHRGWIRALVASERL
jgi:hypothetical protein